MMVMLHRLLLLAVVRSVLLAELDDDRWLLGSGGGG